MSDWDVALRFRKDEKVLGSENCFERDGEAVIFTQLGKEERLYRVAYDPRKFSYVYLNSFGPPWQLSCSARGVHPPFSGTHTYAPLETAEVVARLHGYDHRGCRFSAFFEGHRILVRGGTPTVVAMINDGNPGWDCMFFDSEKYLASLLSDSRSKLFHNAVTESVFFRQISVAELLPLIKWDLPMFFPMDVGWKPDFTPPEVDMVIRMPKLPSEAKITQVSKNGTEIRMPMRTYFEGKKDSDSLLKKAHATRPGQEYWSS